MRRILGIITLGILVSSAGHAQEFQATLITDPSLVGKSAGLDGLWNTADDLNVPGLNTIGAASSFGYTSDPTTDNSFGYWQGTSRSNTVFPNITYLDLNWTGEGSCTTCVPTISNSATSATLAPGGPYTGTLSSFGYVFNQGVQFKVSSTEFGEETVAAQTTLLGGDPLGWQLFNGDDPAIVFNGFPDLISHFQFLLSLAPDDWFSVTTELSTITIEDGPRAGLTGVATTNTYTAVVPLPVGWVLFLSGAAAFTYRRKASYS